jgi:diphthine methyl ester synthase
MESLARGKPVYMPPRYMTTMVAAQQLLEAAAKEDSNPCYNEETKVATATQLIVAGTLKQFATEIEMGEPLHSLCLCGDLHEVEFEMYKHFLYKPM